MADLAVHLDYVKNTIRGYFEDLINIGVTGIARENLALIIINAVTAAVLQGGFRACTYMLLLPVCRLPR